MTQSRLRPNDRQPVGFTTMELTASLISATVLTLGLVSAIGLSTQSLQHTARDSSSLMLPGSLPSAIRQDISDARQITQTSGSGISLVVPDRNGDLSDETISYQYVNQSLRRQENGGSPLSIATGIQRIAVHQDIQTIPSGGPEPTVPGRVKLDHRQMAVFNDSATSVTVNSPIGSVVGDLWLLAVAVDGNELDTLSLTESGWTLLHLVRRGSDATLAVWARVVNGGESSARTIVWSNNRSGVAWAMSFSGVSTTPIYHQQATTGSFSSWLILWGVTGPTVPTTYVAQDSMIVQFAVTEDAQLNWKTSGLNGYVTEFTQTAPTNSTPTIEVSCSHKTFVGTGYSDNSNRYHFYNSCDYILSTIVIAAGSGS
ncbi:MAG: hypothetical protein R3C05_19945 [Pirellulaceae bacterium]